jgi:hypothetical protein
MRLYKWYINVGDDDYFVAEAVAESEDAARQMIAALYESRGYIGDMPPLGAPAIQDAPIAWCYWASYSDGPARD